MTYPPANMLDDDTTTAYRMPGDASGSTITFVLPKEAVISEVGLINGYAKKDRAGNRTVDWYAKNRKILEVEWLFDDGSSVVQNLRTEPVLQTIVVERRQHPHHPDADRRGVRPRASRRCART